MEFYHLNFTSPRSPGQPLTFLNSITLSVLEVFKGCVNGLLTYLFSNKKSAAEREIKSGVESLLPEMLRTKSLVGSAV